VAGTAEKERWDAIRVLGATEGWSKRRSDPFRGMEDKRSGEIIELGEATFYLCFKFDMGIRLKYYLAWVLRRVWSCDG